MKNIVTVLAIVIALGVFCVAADAKILSTRRGVPKGWKRMDAAPEEHPVDFIVALKQRNLDVLNAEFEAITDPKNPRWQEFKTIEEILAIVAPPAADHDAVLKWIQAHGATKVRSMGDAIEGSVPVVEAEKMFHTKFYTFQHQDGRKIVRQWGDFSVPPQVQDFIEFVAGLSEFPIPHYKKITTPKAGTMAIVPETIMNQYGSPSTYKATNSSQGVIEFEAQYFAPADLASFAVSTDLPIAAVASDHIVGLNDPTQPGDEAELDIQYIGAVGQNVTNWFWIEGGTTWLYGFGTHFFSTKDVPLVVSISYGWSEADQCEDGIGAQECQQLGVNSQGYVARVNTEFQKIGARGISILVASGDSGANGRTDESCILPYLLPDYPAASPYVTSVGATQATAPEYKLQSNPPACTGQGYSCVSNATQTAVSYPQAQFASGGGFSNVAAAPSWQTDAIADYFKSGVPMPPDSYYNHTGRGYPDIAAYGSAVLIDMSGALGLVGGTSCSSPISAGIFALLNDYQIKATGKPLGFLNPFIYQAAVEAPSSFTDITVGDNKCTENGCWLGLCKGYECAKGWDPVTGWGSINYNNLLAYLKTLNARRANADVAAAKPTVAFN